MISLIKMSWSCMPQAAISSKHWCTRNRERTRRTYSVNLLANTWTPNTSSNETYQNDTRHDFSHEGCNWIGNTIIATTLPPRFNCESIDGALGRLMHVSRKLGLYSFHQLFSIVNDYCRIVHLWPVIYAINGHKWWVQARSTSIIRLAVSPRWSIPCTCYKNWMLQIYVINNDASLLCQNITSIHSCDRRDDALLVHWHQNGAIVGGKIASAPLAEYWFYSPFLRTTERVRTYTSATTSLTVL